MLYIIGPLLAVLVVFRAGVYVGFRQGAYLHRDFAERGRMMPFGFAGELPQTHGGVGMITSVKLPSITIQTSDGSEKIVLVTASTTIRGFNGNIKPQDLKQGDALIVLGTPDEQGVIDARFIRLLPSGPRNRRDATSSDII